MAAAATAAAGVQRGAKALPKAKATHLVLSCGPSYFQHRSVSIGEETCAWQHHPPPPATVATAAARRIDGVSPAGMVNDDDDVVRKTRDDNWRIAVSRIQYWYQGGGDRNHL